MITYWFVPWSGLIKINSVHMKFQDIDEGIFFIKTYLTGLTQQPHSHHHYNDVIMGTIASQITSLTIVYSFFYWDADQRKHQSSASLAFVRGSHRGPVNSPHKWPVTRKMFPFDYVIMTKASDAGLWILIWSVPEQTLSKQSRDRWFEMIPRAFWRHCNDMSLRRVGRYNSISYPLVP